MTLKGPKFTPPHPSSSITAELAEKVGRSVGGGTGLYPSPWEGRYVAPPTFPSASGPVPGQPPAQVNFSSVPFTSVVWQRWLLVGSAQPLHHRQKR